MRTGIGRLSGGRKPRALAEVADEMSHLQVLGRMRPAASQGDHVVERKLVLGDEAPADVAAVPVALDDRRATYRNYRGGSTASRVPSSAIVTPVLAVSRGVLGLAASDDLRVLLGVRLAPASLVSSRALRVLRAPTLCRLAGLLAMCFPVRGALRLLGIRPGSFAAPFPNALAMSLAIPTLVFTLLFSRIGWLHATYFTRGLGWYRTNQNHRSTKRQPPGRCPAANTGCPSRQATTFPRRSG